jgi:hypothetical protein
LKVVVAAERTVSEKAVLYRLASKMVMFHGGVLAVRGPRAGGLTGFIEQMAMDIALIYQMGVEIHMPEESKGPRASNFKRDYELVSGADLVLAFFSEGSDMGGGTGHVVKAAIDREVAVEAYLVTDTGDLRTLISDGGWLDGEEFLGDASGPR